MFDIGWMEVVVIAIVALIVVGPKDLPGMLRQAGRMMGQLRRTASDFRRQFDDALREAERQAGLDETKKEIAAITKIDPAADIKKEVASIGKIEPPSLNVHEAAPAKTGAAAAPAPAAEPAQPGLGRAGTKDAA